MSTQKSRSSADTKINIIMVVIIVAVLALGVVAVYPKISDNLFQKAYMEGKLPQTVKTYARLEDKSVEEFLKAYGITDASVNGDTPIADAEKFIPLNIYFGSEEQFQAMKLEYGLDESVTGQTLYGEVADVIQAKMEEMASATPTPVEEGIVPIEGEVAPIEGEVTPIEGEVAPVEGEVAPVEGEAAPVAE